jgi:hypothetical protein
MSKNKRDASQGDVAKLVRGIGAIGRGSAQGDGRDDAAQRNVAKLIREIGAIARGSAQNGKALSEDERAPLLKQRRQMAHAVREVAKIIGEHPHEHSREYALINLRHAVAAAFMLGRGATVNPTQQRKGNANAATGRKARASRSQQADEVIISEVKGLVERRPEKRNNIAFLAQQLAKSDDLRQYGLKTDALKKRLRKLRKEGRLT